MTPEFQNISKTHNLAEILCNNYNPPEVSILKQNTRYLFDFLVNKLNAVCLLIEDDYFSQSYFDDYKFFHVNSYKDFPKVCKRIHFFSLHPPKKLKDSVHLFDNSNKKVLKFWNSYLGYIVIRPLPSGVIGATLLKFPVLDNEFWLTHITVKIKNSINIFGYQIEDFETLVYQEQDRIVGACATASLWSALDKAHELYSSMAYSPSKLTDIAGKSSEKGVPQRRYPNRNGLNLVQITQVIETLGLDYDLIVNDESRKRDKELLPIGEITEFLYAYLRFGIPMLLGVRFKDAELHSLTVVGYNEPADTLLLQKIASKFDIEIKGPIVKAHCIDIFYAHDDQVGPFTEIRFENTNKIHTQWEESNVVSFYSALAIIHPTWIVEISLIKKLMSDLDEILRAFDYNSGKYMYWNYFLTASNKWKQELKRESICYNSNIVFKSLPQYIWVLEFFRVENSPSGHSSKQVFSVIIDTTCVSVLSSIIDIIIYDSEFMKFLDFKSTDAMDYSDNLFQLIKSYDNLPPNIAISRRHMYIINCLFVEVLKNSSIKS